jgi:hypothetical protein
MFEFLTLSAHDALMLGAGALAIAGVLVAIGAIHKISPSIKTWLTKEKTTILGLEDKLKSGLGLTSTAIKNVASKASADDVAIREDFSSWLNMTHSAVTSLTARIEALETTVFGVMSAPVAAPLLEAPTPITPAQVNAFLAQAKVKPKA